MTKDKKQVSQKKDASAQKGPKVVEPDAKGPKAADAPAAVAAPQKSRKVFEEEKASEYKKKFPKMSAKQMADKISGEWKQYSKKK